MAKEFKQGDKVEWNTSQGKTHGPFRTACIALWSLSLLAVAATTMAGPVLSGAWPEPDSVAKIEGQSVGFPSHSPFKLTDVGAGPERNPETQATAMLFLPPEASESDPVPAVVMLHGAGGVLAPRELTYGRQFAAMGVAALVVDAFGARSDRASGFTERLIEITEAMVLADAYAALRYLAGLPEVDGSRVALIGFSYGGMAAIFAAYAQVAESYAPDGKRFAAHVSFYAPCITRFEDHRATGAPVLMLFGAKDAIVDRERCVEIAKDLEAGGASVEMIVYEDAYHQWDGWFDGPRMIGRNLAGCRLEVEPDGVVRDAATSLPMTGTLTRKVILALCVDSEGYLIGRDDEVRARSNRDLKEFLSRVLEE